jgi:hypothetical protein
MVVALLVLKRFEHEVFVMLCMAMELCALPVSRPNIGTSNIVRAVVHSKLSV